MKLTQVFACTALATNLVGALWCNRDAKSCKFQIGGPVNTTSGIIYGHRAPNASSVSEYLGIPYAKPPLGPLRFAAPEAYTSDGVINATSLRNDCPINKQVVPTYLPQTMYNVLGNLAQINTVPDEDCLYINIWAKPQSGSAKKPVIVFIYGGGFATGGTNTSTYSGQYWAEQEDVVFVNFNYRINIFGFPGSTETPANPGLLDQRLAIEWVRDNISKFGGDANRIIIYGQSAGGASVDYYNYAYTEDPIIAGSIAQSGSSISFGNKLPETSFAAWSTVAEKLGCGSSTSDQVAVLECMRSDNVTMEKLLAAEYVENGLAAVLGNFGPTVDNKTVFSNYTELAQQGKFIHKPFVIGNNAYEAALFVLIGARDNTFLTGEQWDNFDMLEFNCPASSGAQLRTDAGVPAWRYVYWPQFPNQALPSPGDRAWHTGELMVIFGTSEETSKQDSTWQERLTGSYMRGAWSAFAHCPETGLERYGWPAYSNTTQSLVQIGFGNVSMNNYTPGPTFNLSSAYDECGSYPFVGQANK